MAAKKPNPGFQFILAALKKNKKATYQDISAAAAKKKLKLYPVMFGRAQAMLGIVKQSKRGTGKVARRKAKKASGVRLTGRGPGRPRKNALPTMHGTFDGIIAAVKASERDKARYRAVLERIQAILADVLG